MILLNTEENEANLDPIIEETKEELPTEMQIIETSMTSSHKSISKSPKA